METIVRYNLPVLIMVLNNAGVYGQDRRDKEKLCGSALSDPSPQYIPQLAYEQMMQACGGMGFACSTQEALHAAMTGCVQTQPRTPALINIYMDPNDGQENGSV